MNRRLLVQSAGYLVFAGLAACGGSSGSSNGTSALDPGTAAGIEPLQFSPSSGLVKLNAKMMKVSE